MASSDVLMFSRSCLCASFISIGISIPFPKVEFFPLLTKQPKEDLDGIWIFLLLLLVQRMMNYQKACIPETSWWIWARGFRCFGLLYWQFVQRGGSSTCMISLSTICIWPSWADQIRNLVHYLRAGVHVHGSWQQRRRWWLWLGVLSINIFRRRESR